MIDPMTRRRPIRRPSARLLALAAAAQAPLGRRQVDPPHRGAGSEPPTTDLPLFNLDKVTK